MKNKTISRLLIALSSSALVMGGMVAANYSYSSEVKADGEETFADAVEISDGADFANAVNNATDGLFIRLTNDISYAEKIIVPENCFVTVDLGGHTVFYTSSESNNIGADLTSTLMMQNGTWSGTFDTDDTASGTIILNNFKQILPAGEEDLNAEGTDCNAKGVVFAGRTKMWIVNGCEIHRIATEQGAINPGADSLNPWESGHKDPSIEQEHIAEKQPYNFENPAPAIVGSKSTWEVKATLNEDFTRAQEGGDTYSKVILLKDASLTMSATLAAADKTFDLAGHTLTLGAFALSIKNDTGNNIIRNGKIVGSVDLSIGTGDIEISNLSMTGDITNNAHAVTFNGGHYAGITTSTGQIYLKSGYFSGLYSGDKYTVLGGYYVNRPTDTQLFLGSEVSDCIVIERSITYNYTVSETQPTKDNDYTVAFNDTIEGASFQWYKKEASSVLCDESTVKYLEIGELVEIGQVKSAYDSYEETYSIVIELNTELFADGDIITFKSNVEATTYEAGAGEVTHLDGVEYSYITHSFYGGLYFAIKVPEETIVYDISHIAVTTTPIGSETNARISHSVLNNAEYYCETYLNGVLVKTSNTIKPNAVSFVCETEGATGDNPDTIYQLEGREITLPTNPYTKTCYGFDGWYHGTTKIADDTYTVGSGDETISAKLTYGSHTYSDEWTRDENHHWHAATCEHTDEMDSYGFHQWNSGVITVQPTEETKGEKTFTCIICGGTKTEDVDKLSHEKGNHHDAQSPSCTTDGNVEYWDCKTCDRHLDISGNVIDSIVVPATGHSYSDEWTRDANHHWHAATCEHTDQMDSYGFHQWNSGVITTQPTEETLGVKTFTCIVCNGTKTENVDKLTHEKGQHHDAVDATCTTDGNVEYWDCKNCSNKLDAEGDVISSIVVPATGHSYSSEWSHNESYHWHDATCEHTGEKSNLEAHSWNAGVITTQPTEESKGVKTFTCTVCGETKTEDVAKLTHEKGQHHDAQSPTCTEDGNVEYWDCKNCDKKLDADCNVLSTVVVAATGHSFSDDWSHDNTSHWHAATCGHDEKSSVEEHNFDAGVVTTEPTEEAVGVKTFTCQTCGYTKTEEIAKLTHEKGTHHEAVAATCTTAGTVEYWECEHCDKNLDANGNVLESIIVEELGHNVVKVEALNPQIGVAGHKEYYECTRCHERFEDEACTLAIADLDTWINEGGNGYVAPLAEQTQSLTWLWTILSILLLLVIIYFLGYFFLYRQGKLDDKAIRVIYKWLPRGNKNRKENTQEKRE